ncbi:MAG: hypothetical protein ACE5HS_01960 [bacterium]
MWFFKKLKIIELLTVFTLMPVFFGAEINNYQLLARLADSLLEEVAQNQLGDTTNVVAIRSLNSNDSLNWFIEDRLAGVLQKNNVHKIILQQDADLPDSAKIIFEFMLLSIQINYAESDEQGLTKEDDLYRTGKLILFVRMLRAETGEIMWSGNREKAISDWISAKSVPTLENPNLPFTKGKFTRSERENSLIKPLLITGVTGLIVYLFYALRSR